jgi:hypothetical protein
MTPRSYFRDKVALSCIDLLFEMVVGVAEMRIFGVLLFSTLV